MKFARWLFLVVLLLPLPLFAQTDTAASLTIRFAGGRTQFHVGELIPIELAFSSSAPDTYEMNTRNYDRSGRLDLEQFHVTPPGRDPLASYYSGAGGFMGGGLGSSLTLTSEPQTMQEDLNEWVALDQPGHYTLYVTSRRVSRHEAQPMGGLELKSNSLEFDVIAAEPAWQQQVFASAIAALNSASTDQDRSAALRTLRFLDSPESIRELVRQLSKLPDGRRWDSVGGLAGSRHTDLVLRELEQQMSAADTAITADYIFIYGKLKSQVGAPPLPPYPEHDPEQQKAWTERMQAENQKLTQINDELYRRAAALAPAKLGAARAETVRTLLLRPARSSEDIKPLAGLPEQEVVAAFLALPPDQQFMLVSAFWERLKVPAMVVPLQKILDQTDPSQHMLRDEALRRLYQLDPVAGAERILAEIAHPRAGGYMATVKPATLALLPNETLPQFDQTLAARIEEISSPTRPLDAQLIGRYSTAAILPRVKAVYETAAGKWDCVAEDGFVLYFLRVAPDYGVARLAQANSFCMENSLPAVVRMKRWNEVEPALIARLNDPDLFRARQAAETLAKYGSSKAEKALWQRVRAFHQQWAEHEKDLTYRAGQSRTAVDAMGLQSGLLQALGTAQAWLLSEEEVSQLEELALGFERYNVKQWHQRAPVPLDLTILFDEQLIAGVNNQYHPRDLSSLCRKLAQYPSGTRFLLAAVGPSDLLAPVLRAVNDVAAEQGLIIERAAEQ